MYVKKILLLTIGLLSGLSAFAQIPQQLNYQGALRDSKGFPQSNKTINLRLSIQEAGANGLVHYSEVRQVTTNAVGLYSLAIGSPGAAQTSGNFAQIQWGVGSKSLKVEIDVDGGNNFALAGVSPLLSVPYALYSKYAENGPAGAQGVPGKDGSTILSGTTDPLPGQGNPGDYYFNTTTNVLYGPQNADGTWPVGTVLLQGPVGPQGNTGQTGAQGLAGTPGSKIYSGSANPLAATGIAGDYYFNTTTRTIFGPKNADDTWPAGTVLLQGATGAQGLAGVAGVNGLNCWDTNGNGKDDPAEDINNDGVVDSKDCRGEQGIAGVAGDPGKTILSGTGIPDPSVGVVGDFYIDTAAPKTIYGPKTLAGWAVGTSLVGPQGPPGPGGISTLTTDHILVGDANNLPKDVAMFGDAIINNTGQLLINSGAVTLSKMASGAPDQVYVTNSLGKASLTSFNGLGWTLNGNTGTVDGTHFIGTADNQPLNFRINNLPAGRITNDARGETALGFRAAGSATPNLFYNTLLGYRAGELLGVGSNRNTLVGAYAGFNLAGNSLKNMAVGELSLPSLTVGNNNMAMGSNAGENLTSGNSNIFLGQGSGLKALGSGSNLVMLGAAAKADPGLINAIAIGAGAEVTASNSLVLGGNLGNAVNVGINVSAPESKLHILDGHIRVDQGKAPTAALLFGNGLSSVTIIPNSSDTRGRIDFTGTTNTFGGPYGFVGINYDMQSVGNALPVVMITPGNAAAAECEFFVTPNGNAGFFLNFRAKSANVTAPIFYYMTLD